MFIGVICVSSLAWAIVCIQDKVVFVRVATHFGHLRGIQNDSANAFSHVNDIEMSLQKALSFF
jgi:hypothetical protein